MSGFTLLDACVVAAWMNAELSEGQAMRALGLDRISARILRDKIVATGIEKFALVKLGGTPESADSAMMAYAAKREPQRAPGGEADDYRAGYQDGFAEACRLVTVEINPQRVCAHCETQIIPANLTECPKCDRAVMP